MQVRPRAAAGAAGEGDELAALDVGALLHPDLLEVPVERAQVVAVVQDDGVPVLAPVAREEHGAGGGGHDRRPPVGADVEPAMELQLATPRGRAHAETGVERAVHRPAHGDRQENRTGALHEATERPEALAGLAHGARQHGQRLRQGRRLAGEDQRQHAHALEVGFVDAREAPHDHRRAAEPAR